MDRLFEKLSRTQFRETSIAAIALNTYVRHWDRVTFLSRERDGVEAAQFVPMKSSAFVTRQMALASALMGQNVERGDHVAVFAENSVRYAIVLHAIWSLGAIAVPIYPTTTQSEAEHIIEHCRPRVIFVGGAPQFQKTLPILNRVNSPLARMITLYPHARADGPVTGFDELLAQSAPEDRTDRVLAALESVTGDNTAVLLYTLSSPTSPRGAIITHGNFIAQRGITDWFGITHEDVRLAHLPFGHIFGLVADLFASAVSGSTLCILKSFDSEEILARLVETNPTVICSVPGFYEKMYVNFAQAVNTRPALTRGLYRMAIRTGRASFESGAAGRPGARLMKALLSPVYRSIRSSLSLANTRVLFSGAGQLSEKVAAVAGGTGLPIIEGYGLIEMLPMLNVNNPRSPRRGTMGPPFHGIEERIDQNGEVLVRGPAVFRGYYNNPHENSLAFTDDGYYRTGDTGAFDDAGHLVVTGRLKDRIILTSGRDVRPRNIEKHFENDALVDWLCVTGDRRHYVTALVCPNMGAVRAHARKQRLAHDDDEKLVRHPEIFDLYRAHIGEINARLAPYEQIKKFTLMTGPFSMETGEISPTFKLRRQFIHEKYAELIDRMYPAGEQVIGTL